MLKTEHFAWQPSETFPGKELHGLGFFFLNLLHVRVQLTSHYPLWEIIFLTNILRSSKKKILLLDKKDYIEQYKV